MITAVAEFAVFVRQSPCGVVVITLFTGLSDVQFHDTGTTCLPTYDEAVRIAQDRGMSRQPRIGFHKHLGIVEFVPIRERIVCENAETMEAFGSELN
jgi:hypothetical protein